MREIGRSSWAHGYPAFVEEPLKLLPERICHEGNAQVCFDTASFVVEDRTYTQISFRDTEGLLNLPEMTVVLDHFCGIKLGARHIPLEPIPSFVFCDLFFINRDCDLAREGEKFVVSTVGDLRFRQLSRRHFGPQFLEAFLAIVGILSSPLVGVRKDETGTVSFGQFKRFAIFYPHTLFEDVLLQGFLFVFDTSAQDEEGKSPKKDRARCLLWGERRRTHT